MSQEMVLAFVTKVRQDPALLAKLRPLAADDMTGLLRVAAEAGFDFSAEDYMVAMEAQSIAPANDLSDNDLDVMAGGGVGRATGGAGPDKAAKRFGFTDTVFCAISTHECTLACPTVSCTYGCPLG